MVELNKQERQQEGHGRNEKRNAALSLIHRALAPVIRAISSFLPM
ncbi:MAG: hypothetical protein R3356_07725 [Eudoraea sp.]|nr:hypothetical protein [Eudoraea sp.]